MLRKAIKAKSRRQYDQEKVKKRIKKNEYFISEILSKVFSEDDLGKEVNLYNEFACYRKSEKFLDLAIARYLVGNGLVNPVLNNQKNRKATTLPVFNFREQKYTITKKGLRLIKKLKIEVIEQNKSKKSFAVFLFIILFAVIISTSIRAFAIENYNALFDQIAKDHNYGLVVFYYSGCGSCDLQIKDLATYLPKQKWEPYILIDLNEGAVKNHNIHLKNKKYADSYGIETVPEIWLVKKNSYRGNVGYGYTPRNVLMERVCETYLKWSAQQ